MPEGSIRKNMVGAAPTSSDLMGLDEKCSHKICQNKLSGDYEESKNRIGHGSVHTILHLLVLCSFIFLGECVRDCIFRAIIELIGVWLAILGARIGVVP